MIEFHFPNEHARRVDGSLSTDDSTFIAPIKTPTITAPLPICDQRDKLSSNNCSTFFCYLVTVNLKVIIGKGVLSGTCQELGEKKGRTRWRGKRKARFFPHADKDMA